MPRCKAAFIPRFGMFCRMNTWNPTGAPHTRNTSIAAEDFLIGFMPDVMGRQSPRRPHPRPHFPKEAGVGHSVIVDNDDGKQDSPAIGIEVYRVQTVNEPSPVIFRECLGVFAGGKRA